MAQFKIIAAVDSNMGIGREGRKPWHLPEEESYFHSLVTRTASPQLKNALLTEAAGWSELPGGKRPYPGVINVLIGPLDELEVPPEVLHFESLQDALDELGDRNDLDEIFLVGGAKLFAEGVLHPDLEEINLVHVQGDYDCDSFFPREIPEEFEIVSTSDILESDGLEYSIVVMARNSEQQTDEED